MLLRPMLTDRYWPIAASRDRLKPTLSGQTLVMKAAVRTLRIRQAEGVCHSPSNDDFILTSSDDCLTPTAHQLER